MLPRFSHFEATCANVASSSRAWKEKNGFSYPILQDASGTVGHAYGAKTTPGMFVIDEKGVLRYSGAIDDDPRGKVATPTNYVQKAVNAVASGQPVSPSVTESYGCTVKYEKSS
jgi:alkyl hydroperoxide reductase subunit AhpC